MSDSQASLSELYQQALDCQRQGDLKTAKVHYLSVLQLDPDHADALHSLGNIDAREGRLDDAERLVRKAIALRPLKAAFINSLGNLMKARGKLDEAMFMYEQAARLQPDLAAAHSNLADIMLQTGNPDGAVDAAFRALKADPNLAGGYAVLGRALNNLGRFDEAVDAFRRAVVIRPDYAPAYDHLGHVLRARGEMQEAREAFEHALTINPELPSAWHNLATVRMVEGDVDGAIQAFEKARELRPRHVSTLLNLGIAYHTSNRFRRAVETYREALEIQPRNPLLHLNLGLVRVEERRTEEAERCLKKAIEIDPKLVKAYAELAALYEETNQLEALEDALDKGLALAPNHPRLNLEAAKRDRRKGRIEEGIARLEAFDIDALDPRLAEQFNYQLGYLQDRAGNAPEAFAHFEAANRIAAGTVRAKAARPERFTVMLDRMREYFASADISGWPPAPPADCASPVFMFGFPRSGTTLLDVALDSHPGISTAEEQSTIMPVMEMIRDLPGGFPQSIGDMEGEHIAAVRDAYFHALDAAFAEPPKGVVIDKMPIRTVYAGVLWRLFPDARFIFCLRHPCDVVLSNFMQHYTANDAFANFFTLEGSVKIYDRTMRLWQTYLDKLPLNVHTVRYEHMVEDLEQSVREVLSFLDLPWDPAVLKYAERAIERGRINTNSYHQVTEAIYTRSRDRWRAYGEFLEPHLAVLRPHLEYFGYDD
jgi:tetratricopeptide (TPR) repeat protein